VYAATRTLGFAEILFTDSENTEMHQRPANSIGHTAPLRDHCVEEPTETARVAQETSRTNRFEFATLLQAHARFPRPDITTMGR
jgi:hypothetical protein